MSPPPTSEQSISIQLLPRAQRGTLQAAAQTGAASAVLAEAGAAEAEIALSESRSVSVERSPLPELPGATKRWFKIYLFK